jgi:hypothetical protein
MRLSHLGINLRQAVLLLVPLVCIPPGWLLCKACHLLPLLVQFGQPTRWKGFKMTYPQPNDKRCKGYQEARCIRKRIGSVIIPYVSDILVMCADANCLVQHPISLKIQMPSDSSRPEWKLDGSVVTIPELPLNLLVSTLRERIVQNTGTTVPVSWMRLSHDGRMLANKNTVALYNLEDDDLVYLNVKDPKKK